MRNVQELRYRKSSVELEEQRSPPIHLVNRVPGVLKGLGRLVYAIRVEGDGPGKHRVKIIMPEGPEVEVVRAALAQQLPSQIVRDVYVSKKALRRPVQKKDFRFLLGETIQSVKRRGKFLYFMTNDTQGFWCRLGMSGNYL